jgi:prepilin-type N-terminal cleavage/methylation domain-containing protein/prepilin-type processing-associated H-X9-DG protein
MSRGLTLVEVLAVVAVIALALLLLLPPVNVAREAARRANCSQNHKQLGLSLLNYEAGHRQFPGFKQELAGRDVGWVVMILPYQDRAGLWAKWKQGTPEKKFLRVMFCPSDPPPTSGPGDGPCSYAVNTKVCMDGKGFSSDYIGRHDGTATTLLLGENLRVDKAHNWWDTDPVTVGFTVGPMAENVGSNHGGGVVASYCDGHVAFLRYDIGDDVFKALVTPDGGEKVDESEL